MDQQGCILGGTGLAADLHKSSKKLGNTKDTFKETKDFFIIS